MRMKIIATDEAGYGPKLGPLVIGATAWQIPAQWAAGSPADLARRFALLKERHRTNSAVVTVDDSKNVFQPKSSAKKNSDPLANLHATVSAAIRWCEAKTPPSKTPPSKQPPSKTRSIRQRPGDPLRVNDWIESVASQDIATIRQTDWLKDLSQQLFLEADEVSEILHGWSSSGASLDEFSCRVITAAEFNRACNDGMNKADLLSESTLGLVKRLFDTSPQQNGQTMVFCDRHGGRRYYAGVLQHIFADANIQVVSESKQQSVYRMHYDGQTSLIHFTVKGDSFTPVALSSIFAKYIRERMMESFNAYFQSLQPQGRILRPTAGYPVDADRFLSDIAPIVRKHSIDVNRLVRQR